VALTLEGGYDLAALRASAAATVRGLLAGRAEAGSG
jgi:acetoin utilization deacetylase AcuC-like enzyme